MTKRLISFFLALVFLVAIPLSARYKYNPYTRKLDYYEPATDADLGDLGDVTLTGLATGNILYYDGAAWVNLATGANTEFLTLAAGIPAWAAILAGVTTFLGLTDTPGAYAGKAGQLVRVNAGENALEFFAGSPLGTVIIADGAGGWTKTENYRVSAAGAVTLGSWTATAVANTYVAGINQNLLTTSTPTFDDLTISTPVNIYGLSHNSFADYAANRHVVLPNTLANVLSDHNLAAHTVLGLFDASSDVDHDATTNYLAAQHLTLPAGIVAVLTDHNLAAHTALGLFDASTDVDHDATTNYAANQHVVLPGTIANVLSDHNIGAHTALGLLALPDTIANVLSDHNLVAHTALGLFDASSDVDHDLTTNYVANQHIDWTVASANFSTTGTFTNAMDAAAEVMNIIQSAVAGPGNVPLIFIDDARTGATANVKEEATIRLDAEGIYSIYFEDGWQYFGDRSIWETDIPIYIGGGVDQFVAKWDSNGVADGLMLMGGGDASDDSSALMFIKEGPTVDGMTDHDDYKSTTFVVVNRQGADGGDYSAVVMGERTQANVAIAHYFDFYAMTGALDGVVDPTTTELGAIFRFGDSGTTVPTYATGAGDVLFEDDVEVIGSAHELGDATNYEDVFWTWADAADHAVIAQSAVAGTEDQPLIFIDDDRTGATATELSESTIIIDAEGVYGFYVKDGKTRLDDALYLSNLTSGRIPFTAANGEIKVSDYLRWDEGDNELAIGNTSPSNPLEVWGEGTSVGSPGSFAHTVAQFRNTLSNHTAISINALIGYDAIVYFTENMAPVWDIRNASAGPDFLQIRYQVGQVNDVYWRLTPSGDVAILEGDFSVTMDAAADQIVFTQSAVAGTENQPLIFINDDRTGATANEMIEATYRIDADGVYALFIEDGTTVVNKDEDFGWALPADNQYMGFKGKTISNGTGNALMHWMITTYSMGGQTTAILYTGYEADTPASEVVPNNMTDHNSYVSPTFVIANNKGADANDYAAVVIGERAQADVKVAHYFDFYAMTGAFDGSPDGANAELGAIFRFGASGTTVPTTATSPGDVLFEGKIEVVDWLDFNATSYSQTYGYQAGDSLLVGGTHNVLVGYQAGLDLTTGDENVFIGKSAGQNITTTVRQIFIGPEAGVGDAGGVTGVGNIGIGYRTGYSINSAYENVFIGHLAGESLTSGNNNFFLGYLSGRYITTGRENVFIGSGVGTKVGATGLIGNVFIGAGSATLAVTTAQYNTAVGMSTAQDITSGYNNVFIGKSAGANITDGHSNVFVGYAAGILHTRGHGNVFIGNYAGGQETGLIHDKLFIDNSNTATPLIYGDFSTEIITINGDFHVTGEIESGDYVVSQEVNWDDVSPVAVCTVADGYMVTDVWCEVTTIADGDLVWTVGDGGTADGFLTDADIVQGVAAYYGFEHDARGGYLYDAGNNHTRDKIYAGADTVDCFITESTATQGVIVVYVHVTRIK